MDENPATKPTKRNALMTFLVPAICWALAPPLGNFLGTTSFRFSPTAAILAGTGIFFMYTRQMMRELRSVTEETFPWWHLLIPIYGLYVAATSLRIEMGKAKQKLGKGPPRGAIAYAFLFLYAFASDLNDLAS